MMRWLTNCATAVTTTLLASSSSIPTSNNNNDVKDIASGDVPVSMRVTSLARYAVKGLSPDVLRSVHIATDGEGTFPDDRRFALLKSKIQTAGDDNDDDDEEDVRFDEDRPEWIHKQNFLCAFTAPELMATLDCEYRIVRTTAVGGDSNSGSGGVSSTAAAFSFGLPNDAVTDNSTSDTDHPSSPDGTADETTRHDDPKRLLTLWNRHPVPPPPQKPEPPHRTSPPLLGPIDLTSPNGRARLAAFFSTLSSEQITCVSPRDAPTPRQTHQFGNTRAGVRNNNGDTRTVHIVNAATVRQVSERIGVELDPMRFRPNIVVDGLEAWGEFDFVGRTLRVVSEEDAGMEMDVLSTTVRCAGIGIDPLDPQSGTLDMPVLLAKHFPQYGPYLGVYATVRTKGTLQLGDQLELLQGSTEGRRCT